MALSYNLGYQESISVHPTRRQIFAGKPYLTFPNIWEWVIPPKNDDVIYEQPLKRRGSKYQKKWEEIKFLNTNSSRQIGLFSSAGNITMLAQNCYRPNFDFWREGINWRPCGSKTILLDKFEPVLTMLGVKKCLFLDYVPYQQYFSSQKFRM